MNIAIEKLKRAACESKNDERQRKEKEMAEFKEHVLENVIELLQEDPRIKLGNPTQLCFYINYNETALIMTTRKVPYEIKDHKAFWFNPLLDDPIGENEKRIPLPWQMRVIPWSETKTINLVSDVLKNGEIPTSKEATLFLRLSLHRVEDRLFRTYVIDLV